MTTDVISNWLGTKTVGPAGCTEPTLGYNIPESLFNAIDAIPGVDLNGLERSLIKKLTYALVVFPVGECPFCPNKPCFSVDSVLILERSAAGFAAFVLLLTFLAWCTRSRGFEICAFIVSWLAAGVSTEFLCWYTLKRRVFVLVHNETTLIKSIPLCDRSLG